MQLDEVKAIIIKSFEESGILIDECPALDVDLREKIVDSLQFISSALQIEENLGIVLTDDLIAYENLASLNAFAQSLKDLMDAEGADERVED